MRKDWDTYFMDIAEQVAQRSTCLRRKVGAVLVKDNKIIATGYNGSPAKVANCCDTGKCLREELNIPSGERHELCRAVHAEANALIQCAVAGTSCQGATIYITTSPCNMCLKQLINADIKRIVSKGHYPDKMSEQLLKEASIEMVYLGE